MIRNDDLYNRHEGLPQENLDLALIDELEIARLSQPSPQQLTRYKGMHHDVVQQSTSLLTDLIQRIQATLAWDSRQQPMLQGARSVGERSYRLLYTTEQAEVEMMVEPLGQQHHVEGEIIEVKAGDLLPALITLEGAEPMLTYETACDEHGRFHFESVAAGGYQMSVVLADGGYIAIDHLEIS